MSGFRCQVADRRDADRPEEIGTEFSSLPKKGDSPIQAEPRKYDFPSLRFAVSLATASERPEATRLATPFL